MKLVYDPIPLLTTQDFLTLSKKRGTNTPFPCFYRKVMVTKQKGGANAPVRQTFGSSTFFIKLYLTLQFSHLATAVLVATISPPLPRYQLRHHAIRYIVSRSKSCFPPPPPYQLCHHAIIYILAHSISSFPPPLPYQLRYHTMSSIMSRSISTSTPPPR